MRPHCQEFLQEMSQKFEIIVYTAGTEIYANAVLDKLDPDLSLITYRLYRQNCTLIDNLHIKNLDNIVNRSIADTIIVDNIIYSFSFHLGNGIPIRSFFTDETDNELLSLKEILLNLDSQDNVQYFLEKTLHLKKFYEFLQGKIHSEHKQRSVIRIN